MMSLSKLLHQKSPRKKNFGGGAWIEYSIEISKLKIIFL